MRLPNRPRRARYTGSLKLGALPWHRQALWSELWSLRSEFVQVIGKRPQPPPPVKDMTDNTQNRMNWGVMGNDTVGDCVIACAGHTIMAWTSLATGNATVVSDQTIIQAYSAITGYNPATGSGDNGMKVRQGLDYWKSGAIAGHGLSNYVPLCGVGKPMYGRALSPKDRQLWLDGIRKTIAEFGVCIMQIGINQNILEAFRAGDTWNDWYGGITDYHCVPLIAYDDQVLECITWGQIQRMDWDFCLNYIREAYVAWGPDMLRQNGQTFSGHTLTEMAGFGAVLSTDCLLQ